MKTPFYKYKLWLIICVISVGSLFFFSCQKKGSDNIYPEAKKPNIILILADDFGYEVPGYTGGQSYSTPVIDNLAGNGVRFSQCNVCPSCSPTRIELLTGKYGFRNYTGWGNLNPDQKTIANMLRDVGYKTCVAGKWQLGGGDASIRAFGFDKYLVFQPFYVEDEREENLYRYKNPKLYENGNYLPGNITNGKYADDMFSDYIYNFIDSNLSSPFFIYFPLSLCHRPYSPTPDDPGFATWNPLVDTSNTVFFPSMVHYMDKKIGQLIDKINAVGLSGNTIIIFLGDNGTASDISSMYKGYSITGGKNGTTIYGTHVPLIVDWPGTIAPQQSSPVLIDAADFLPTIASLANIKKPSDYGTMDGVSFYSSLFDPQQRVRNWIYSYWKPGNLRKPVFKVWVQDESYKLYDSTNQNLFFNIAADPLEQSPLSKSQLTPTEVNRKKTFDSVLKAMY